MNATEHYDAPQYPATGPTAPGAQPGQAVPAHPPAQSQQGATPRPGRRHSWVGILATVLGSLVLVGLFSWTLVTGFWQGSIKSFSEEVSVSAAESLRVDIRYGEIEIEFSDRATEATLEVSGRSRGGESPVTLTNTGSEVVLESRDESSWFGEGASSWREREVRGVLTLPGSLQGAVDFEIEVEAGTVSVNGEANAIEASIGAGQLIVNDRFETGTFSAGAGSVILHQGGGSARVEAGAGEIQAYGSYDELDVTVSVGSFILEGTVRDRAQIVIETGSGNLAFLETMPQDTRVETSIGDIDISVPDVPIELDAPRSVRLSAEDAGLEVDGGPDAAQVLILTDIGDVTFD